MMPGRLICFTAAACVDRYIRIPELRVGQLNRPSAVTAQAGGKGVNVARTAHALGASVQLVGHASRPIRDEIDDSGIPATWSESSQTRVCTVILDETSNELTEIYEPLPPEPPDAWPIVRETYAHALARAGSDDVLTISARLPAEFPDSALATLVAEAHAVNVPCWIDTDDRGLARCLTERPDLVKINHHEAAEFTGTVIDDPYAAAAAGSALCAKGAESTIITLGEQGCVYADVAGNALHQPAPSLAGALPVGSGDAFLAGLGVAALRGLPRIDALRLATATASITAQHLVTGDITSGEVEQQIHTLGHPVDLTTGVLPHGVA